jgi:hypothetical protein
MFVCGTRHTSSSTVSMASTYAYVNMPTRSHIYAASFYLSSRPIALHSYRSPSQCILRAFRGDSTGVLPTSSTSILQLLTGYYSFRHAGLTHKTIVLLSAVQLVAAPRPEPPHGSNQHAHARQEKLVHPGVLPPHTAMSNTLVVRS